MSLTNTPDITVNGNQIPASAIDAEIQYHPAATRREAMVKAAESLIIGELLSQKAKEKGMISDSQQLNFEEDSSLIDDLMDQEIDPPQATEIECERYYQANLDKFKNAPLVEAKHILLAADPEDLEHSSQMKELANKLIDQLKRDESQFSEFAKAYSACPSKEVTGSLGQLSSGQTVPEFERQLFAAKAGLMHTPIETRYGFHVVYIARKVEGKVLPYAQVKEKIEQYLNDKVQRKAYSQYLHLLVSEAEINGFAFEQDISKIMQ
jgi:peptidyl-prolyl cis-trans isomerase C